jgi:hypothetical protein
MINKKLKPYSAIKSAKHIGTPLNQNEVNITLVDKIKQRKAEMERTAKKKARKLT